MINLLFLIFVTLLATNLAFANDVSTSTVKKPLNVLFILTDDQATDTISAHGNKRISTPNIDRLANAGTSFTHVFNQGSWSPAVCAPSRRMINSGRHIFHTGMGPDNHKQGNDTKDFKMFGETFKDAGYQTFMTGKWHLPMSIFERSFTQGKAIFKSGMARENDGGQWQAAFVDYVPSAKGTNKYLQYKGDKHTSEMVAEAAVTFLSKQKVSKQQVSNKSVDPFMMYVAFLAPHDPRQSPDSYVAKYPGNTIDLPVSYKTEHPFNQGDHYIRDEILADFPRKPEVIKDFIGEYYAMIEHMDTQIGKVLDALEDSGQADNTLIIFTSDHGLAVGKHGLLGKQNQYDHSVRAPFIIKGPDTPKGKTAKGMFYISSAFPTAVDLAGLEIPSSVQMPSVAPLIRGEKVRGDKDTMFDSIYGSYRHFQRMLRTDDYKLIYYPRLKKSQLFDMNNDPDELIDLAAEPEHATRITTMMAELETWKKRVGDPLDNNDVENSFKMMGGINDKDHRARDWKNKPSH